ncbi:hypothetical protein RND81_07G168400 [Saponaria officinalis]|uniref:Uncharacterized protein n=1 Tax=Saponaria officinalis TaxID=3572 RepID=A0AAW1JTA1_SAPOF
MELYLNVTDHNGVSDRSPQVCTKNVVAIAKEETLTTPTSDENKIPAPESPPPAPRKRRRVALHCVRKLEFLENRIAIPADQAVKEFFVDQMNSQKVLKRSTSLAFDRLNSSNLTFAQQII